MALSTFAELKASIAAWADRTDLTAVIPDFITLFETTANAELPLRTTHNLTSTTLVTVANVATVALPTDFLEAKSLVNQTNPYEILKPETATSLYTNNPSQTAGKPKGFTYVGSNLELAPIPDAVYSLKLYYYQKVVALSDTNTTNWLLTNFPNLYLFGTLLAAEAYLGMDPRLKLWGDLYDNMLQKLDGSKDRGQYGGSPLSVSVTGVV